MQLQTVLVLVVMFSVKKCKAQTDNDNVVSVTAFPGGTARLPCRVAPEVYGNNITVLTWYNDKSTKAIYSRDHRRETPTPATSRSDHRFAFSQAPGANMAFLFIRPVLAEDAGLYRCHVDFESSRAHDTYVQLNLIESPSHMILLSGNGTKLSGATAGPYREGDDAVLICVVFGGDPLPNVTWWRGTEMVDDSWSQFSLRRVRNELALGKLKRQHYGQQYSCQATNNDMAAPMSANVTIDMYLKPTQVLLYAGQEPVRAGPLELQCRILGARPTPTFIWMVGNKQLDLEQNVVEDSSGRGDLSTVTISVTAEDNGLNVTCCTEKHSRRLSLMCSAPHTLDVYHTPVVQLTVDSEVVNETAVLLGTSLTLACNITANPSIFNFAWLFNNEVIKSSDGGGGGEEDEVEEVEADSVCPVLTLEQVTQAEGGVYRCSATNKEGIGQSQSLTVHVQYSPRCVSSTPTEYGLGNSESVNMTCNVSANPPPNTYQWLFFNSSTLNITEAGDANCEPLDITLDNVLEYHVSEEFGYGTVLCWGQNDVSNVSSPDPADACVFTITDLSIPHQPSECAVVRQDNGDIAVSCEKGHDGGLQQKFTLTLLSGNGEELLVVSALEPQLTAHEPTDPDYSILITAHNDKGTTEPITLTRADVTQQLEEGPRGVVADVGTLLLSLGGGVGVVVLIACALVMGARELRSDTGSDGVPRVKSLRRKTSSCPYATDESNCDTCQDSEGGSENSFHRTESFRRAVTGKPSSRDSEIPRGGSFRAPRCIADGSPLLRHTDSCRLHSLQNICSTLGRREGEALCDHLLLHLPADLPNYSIPKTPVPFYTMPRKSHLRVKPQESIAGQHFDSLPLPPPPDEFHTFRSATEILKKEVPVTKPPTMSNNYMNVPNKAENAYNNVIISPMNTVGLPSSSGATTTALYTYPEEAPHTVEMSRTGPGTSTTGLPCCPHDSLAQF